jgi:hypothetical protein
VDVIFDGSRMEQDMAQRLSAHPKLNDDVFALFVQLRSQFHAVHELSSMGVSAGDPGRNSDDGNCPYLGKVISGASDRASSDAAASRISQRAAGFCELPERLTHRM